MTSRLQARLLAQRALFQRLQSSKKRSKLQAGFTLIELLIVVIIIGILASVALPTFLNQSERAREQAARGAVSAAARSCQVSLATGDPYTNPANVTGTCAENQDLTYTGDNGETAVVTIGSGGNITADITYTP